MMGIAAASVALLLLVSALLSASFEAIARIAPLHLRTLEEEGFEGADALAAVREHEGAARLSVRIVSMACDLAAIGIIALTGVSTWGLANPLVSTAEAAGGAALAGVAILIPILAALASLAAISVAVYFLLRHFRGREPAT